MDISNSDYLRATKSLRKFYKQQYLFHALEMNKYFKWTKHMDKQINKVKKDIKKGDKEKGLKDTKKLLKMDKKFDKKLEKCGYKMK